MSRQTRVCNEIMRVCPTWATATTEEKRFVAKLAELTIYREEELDAQHHIEYPAGYYNYQFKLLTGLN